MIEDYESDIDTVDSLFDILKLLKHNIMLTLNVSTLAFIQEIIQEKTNDNNYGIIRVKPFPVIKNQDEYSILAYYFDKLSNPNTKINGIDTEIETGFKINDIVQIVFCDKNFINNLQVKDNSIKPTNDIKYHSLKYGIVVKTR
mgnify:CR=1 FL=1